MMCYSVMTQAYSEKEIPSSPNRSRTYDLPITSSDALPLSYRRLVGAKAIKLGSWDKQYVCLCHIEDITCPRVDTNFIFECSTRYLTSERSERVRYRVEHEKIKFVSTSGHVIFCLLYRHRCNTRKTISWTNPLFAESCINKISILRAFLF